MFITRRQLRNIIRENIVTDTLRQATKSAGGEGAPERDPEEVKNMIAASSQDAYGLYDALVGVGTDEAAVRAILKKRNQNLKELSQEYDKLMKHIKRESSGGLVRWLAADDMNAESEAVRNAVLGEWRLAKDFKPSKSIYEKIRKHEAAVPYVYDDGGTMSKEYAKKLYGKIIDSPAMQSVINAWPKDRIQIPVTDMKSLKRYATIGVGHLIKDEAEFNLYKEFTLKNITTDKEGNKIDQEENDLSNKLMSKDEIMELFYEDVDNHTTWKKDITQPITQSMFDSMTSIAFNSGAEEGRPIYAVIKLINNKKYSAAKEKIKSLATTSKGEVVAALVTRRKEESDLFGSQGLTIA
tara:strand:- start:319 stop:1377 length:1059 start_codon:yes stop_codon:yes gene_type:complete